ncbi:ABC transporter ATP-binding protein [Alicyclobacillus dauci]|uniref:ABC transporter ATP-binding protein n=1 Tax=Alicyclobacillus dauci TaxID=1475485 RepID=A0ABY6Z0F8_9BACL|nr:ABC transporter ATP-binding protein [Alicyclobacillus dauci]WAH36316.1 ABC transporter ATP-binding protein [Alicyclobacillus dauci]
MSKLELTHVTRRYPGGTGVQDVSLTVDHGELVSLLGPSGCGKTTLLRLVGGFLSAEAGEIRIGGENIAALPPEKRPTVMVFQQYNLWPHMSVFENLAFGLKLRKLAKQEINRRVSEALETVRLEGVANRRPTELSGGQQQRVAVARALVLKPEVMLLDEPFSNLDAKLRIALRDELRRIQRETQITMVFVTHDQEEALFLSDRVAVMNQGRIEQVDTPVELYDSPKSLFVAQFIGEMNCLNVSDNTVWRDLLKAQDAATGGVCVVRPEHVSWTDEVTPLRGTVVSSSVAGHFIKLHLDTNVGRLIAYANREGGEAWPTAQPVYLRFQKLAVFSQESRQEIAMLV